VGWKRKRSAEDKWVEVMMRERTHMLQELEQEELNRAALWK
jgi:hypothetical protein